MQRGQDEFAVVARYPSDQRRSIGDLENMRIRTPDGTEVPFGSVAQFTVATGYSSLRRYDRQRSVQVIADIDPKTANSRQILSEIEQTLIPEILSRYPGVQYHKGGGAQEEQRALYGFYQGAAIALLAIYALMAIPLRSYAQPFLIMLVIPFGIVGAVAGHWLLGLNISVLSLCGFVAVAGVVVNDSLIMVDFVNRARRAGQSVIDAAWYAGGRRFRAIVLTSLTTFFGLLPILLERSLQAQIVIPMAISLAFGILFATVITLFLIPCLYLSLNDLERWWGQHIAGRYKHKQL